MNLITEQNTPLTLIDSCFGVLLNSFSKFRICALWVVLPLASTFAEVITVDDDGIADFSSIQAALDYASNGDGVVNGEDLTAILSVWGDCS